MRRLFGALVLLAALPSVAADWYVAPGGADTNAGTMAAPLASLAAALSHAGNGDHLFLARGGTYAASGLNAGSGRSVAAYGAGADPVLTASTPITFTGQWATNSQVRTASVAAKVLALYVDGRFVPLARYPNTGFLRIDNDNAPNQIVDAELASRPGVAAGRWTGAQVRWRRWSWWWETRPIASHGPATTLALGADGKFQDDNSDPGSGYFIDDDLDELDAPGEWFWGNGTLYAYPPSWATAGSTYEVVTTDAVGVQSSGTSFTNVQFQRYAGTALELGGPTTVDGCTFAELETDGIRYTWNAQPFVIRGSTFRDVRNVAISGWANAAGPAGSLIERNSFTRIGMERGYGGSGSWHAAAIIIGQANQATVQHNRFVDVGYAGVILGSDGQTVQRNILVRTMGTLNDGAAIYTNCNASHIRENIILDTIGNLETSHEWYPMGSGIWPEFLSDFHDTEIVDNTIYGSNGRGIFLPNNFTCTVAGNVAVDSRVAGLGLSGTDGENQAHTITGNTLAVVWPTRRLVRPENLSHWWLPPYAPPPLSALEFQAGLDYGDMTGTTFIAPASGAHVVSGVSQSQDTTTYDTLAAWTAAAPTWASATGSSVVRKNPILLFNDTEAAADMPVPAGSWTRPDGAAVGATVHLEPFRSAVLVTDDPVAASPPYHAASGIDWRASDPGAAGGGSGGGGGSTGTGGGSTGTGGGSTGTGGGSTGTGGGSTGTGGGSTGTGGGSGSSGGGSGTGGGGGGSGGGVVGTRDGGALADGGDDGLVGSCGCSGVGSGNAAALLLGLVAWVGRRGRGRRSPARPNLLQR
jgi:hypothetical protein